VLARLERKQKGVPDEEEAAGGAGDDEEAGEEVDDEFQLFRDLPRFAGGGEHAEVGLGAEEAAVGTLPLETWGGQYMTGFADIAGWLKRTMAEQPVTHWDPASVRRVKVSELSGSQLLAVRIVDECVLRRLAEPDAGEVDPLYLTVMGPGGCGKSHVIKAIQKVAHHRKPGCLDAGASQQVALAAPTGTAAFNIGGVTIHSLLSLPTTGVISDLTGQAKGRLQARLTSLRLIILDEHSMTGLVQLAHIDQRLRQAKESTRPFGGVSMVFTGDNAQLPPVKDTAKYSHVDPPSLDKRAAVLLGRAAYQRFTDVVVLERAFRQSSGDAFYGLLTRLRDSKQTNDDWLVLKARDTQDLPQEEQARFGNAVSSKSIASPCSLRRWPSYQG
jgi:energy-coupling factor transporter ATP-binding protein EcfA2